MTDTVLIVDNNQGFLAETRQTLEMNGFHVLTAADGYEALHILEHTRPGIIISDDILKGCDGFTLLESVRARFDWITIPFLFLTDLNEVVPVQPERGLREENYLTRPFSSDRLVQRVKQLLARSNILQISPDTETVLRTMVIMAKGIEARDRYTGGHLDRVGVYAQELAHALGWEEHWVAQLRLAAILHDIGKITIPDRILNKNGPFSPDEWKIMRTHPSVGADLVSPVSNLPLIVDGVLCHHERFDGGGYPRGLAGEAIPAAGRLLAVVDAFDAMTSDRPYRSKFALEAALAYLEQEAGKHFDPSMALAFIVLMKSPQGIRLMGRA